MSVELTTSFNCGEICIQNNQTIFSCTSCKSNCKEFNKFILHIKKYISCSVGKGKTKSGKLRNKSHHKIADIFASDLQGFRIVCSFCQLGFLYYSLFAEHAKECAPKNNNFLICPELKSKRNSYNGVKLLQEKDYTDNKTYHCCNVCDKKFGKKSALIVHLQVHTREKSFKCQACEKTFKHCGSLKVHFRQHTGETPYKCPLCDKSFQQSSTLAGHLRIHIGDKPYKCNVCNTAYNDKWALAAHKTVHTDDRPFKCKYCDGCFKRSNQLAEHTRIHRGVKRYKCQYCEKCFIRSSHLSRHIKTHSGEKPYQCDICDKFFTLANSLKRHKLIHARRASPNEIVK